jgi:D-glycero-D-manno-heptose 1,7-bisphosphate phosphatase
MPPLAPRRAAVFVDRDGTINRAIVREGKPYPPEQVDDFELLAGASSALHSLRDAGFVVVVVTNQPDVAEGRQERAVVEQMNAKLIDGGLCDAVKTCYHSDRDGCDCRKPKPGMLLEAAREWDIDLARSFMIGDRWRDVRAGQTAGCYTFLIENGYSERRVAANAIVESLAEAAQVILDRRSSTGPALNG